MTFVRGNHPHSEFKPSHTPWNKDKKGIHLSPKTEFKKGLAPHNFLPAGTVTQREDKNHKLRSHIKSENGQWIEFAKWLWIEKWGPLIIGDVVHHLNGDFLDDRLENLIALPGQDHPKYHNQWGVTLIPTERLKYYRSRYFYRVRLDYSPCEIDPQMFKTGLARHSQQELFE